MLLFVILSDSDLKNLIKFSSSGLFTQISKEIHMWKLMTMPVLMQ